jgi:hypothetical protein
MWISKKKWNEMCDVVNKLNFTLTSQRDNIDKIYDRLEKNRTDIENLIDAHHKYEKEELGYTCGGLPVSFKTRLVTKYNHAIDTNEIKGVTLEELAKFIIDKTPIERDKTVKVKYYKGE